MDDAGFGISIPPATQGRWANRKMLDIYIQEVTALVYLQRIPLQAKNIILQIAGAFIPVLEKSCTFLRAGIPLGAWHKLFQV